LLCKSRSSLCVASICGAFWAAFSTRARRAVANNLLNKDDKMKEKEARITHNLRRDLGHLSSEAEYMPKSKLRSGRPKSVNVCVAQKVSRRQDGKPDRLVSS